MSALSLAKDKAQLRASMKQKRRQLSSAFVHTASIAICRLIQRQPFFHSRRRIGFYVTANNEASLALLVQTAKQRNKRCYYPALNPLATDRALVFLSDDSVGWRLNKYAIAEPSAPLAKGIASHTLDLVLLPLVAFDNNGGRLGMGAGYYDKTFKHLAGKSRQKRGKTILVGVGYEFQRVRKVPTDEMDVLLDFVVTEKDSIACRSV